MAQAFQSNAFENSAFEASSGGGAIAYSLTCSAGSYTYTGIASNLKQAHTLLCSTGSYSVTGQASLLKVAHKLICGSGSYALNGVSANLRVVRTLTCSVGAYTYTGQNALTRRTYRLPCDVGAYSFVGQSATLSKVSRLTCSAGAYTYTGVDATLSYVQPQTLKQIITDLSLTTGLKLCLDAGDKNSYDTAVQTVRWFDTSGNGFDSFRGATGSVEASDPTFNGSVGALTRNEFFSFDGGDYFTYDTTNETWMNNLHKDSAVYTILFVFDYGTASNQALFSTRGAAQGLNFVRDAGGGISVTVYNNVSAVNLNAASTATVRSGWNIGAVSVNEPTGAGNFLLNGSANSFTSTYTGTLTALNVTSTAKIATRATATALTAANGSKIACVAIWEGVALTSTQLEDVYTEISKRFEGAYSITCESGTYTFTGNDASLIYPNAYSLACDVGTYSLTGQNANLKVSRSLTCSVGSYSLSGVAINLRVVRNINASSGSYSFTGKDALLKRGYRITASAGSYSVTGQNATLTYTNGAAPTAYSLLCAVGVYEYVGQSTELRRTSKITCSTGVYSISGSSSTLVVSRKYRVLCEAGAYTLNDPEYIDPDYIDDYYVVSNVFKVARKLICSTGGYTYTGSDIVSNTRYELVCEAGTYSYTGSNAYLKPQYNYKLTCSVGSYTYIGTDANLKQAHSLVCSTGSYTYTGVASSGTVGIKLKCEAGTYSYTGSNAYLKPQYKYRLTCSAGTYTYTSSQTNLQRNRYFESIAVDLGYTVIRLDAPIVGYAGIGNVEVIEASPVGIISAVPTPVVSLDVNRYIRIEDVSIRNVVAEVTYGKVPLYLSNPEVIVSDETAFDIGTVYIDILTIGEEVAIDVESNVAEAVTVSDVIVSIRQFNRDFTETATVSDVATTSISFTRIFDDSATVDDVVELIRQFNRDFTETTTISETFSTAVAYSRALEDTASMADSAPTFGIGKVLVDTTTSSDTMARSVSTPKTDSVTATDSISVVLIPASMVNQIMVNEVAVNG